MMWVLGFTGWAVIICTVAALFAGRIKLYQAAGLASVASAVFMVNSVLLGSTGFAVVDAGMVAFYAYLWWRGGGDDDTKKRLRKIAKAFRPVRRTAPSAA